MSDLLVRLARYTGLSVDDVRRIVATAPKRYKTYLIAKRSGGFREIAQPARELKLLQYALIEDCLANLPVHAAAMAYQSGRSIRNNAIAHSGETPILKLDFKEFFPSIHFVDWRNYCQKNSIFSDPDILVSSQILFRKAKREKTLKLSIGAPSSPILSNILLFEFDEYVQRQAEKRSIVYTRYADDMTFSGQRIGILKDMIRVVQTANKEVLCPRLQLNLEKTNFVSTKYRRNVTGLVLGNSGEVGVGREKLRIVRARVHKALTSSTSNEELLSLAGYLSFLRDVDKASFEKLVRKYGKEQVDRLSTTNFRPRTK